MKQSFLILLTLILCASCSESLVDKKEDDVCIVDEQPLVIANCEVPKSELVLNQLEGIWYYKKEPYNGFSLRFHPNNTVAERLGFYNGKREGIARRWSDNGVLRTEFYYKQNRLVGIYKSWWENGTLASESNYKDGKLEGIAREWYPTGVLAKERQLIENKENGLQKAWLQNGTLYVNYEAKNGRIFGMKRANSCYKLEDEIIIREKKI